MSTDTEAGHWQAACKVEKWHDEESRVRGDEPYEVVEDKGNLLLNAGITRLLDLLKGAGGQAYDATHCRIGVGNGATAASAAQTDLQAAAGAGNRQFKLCTSVTVSAQTLTVVASFPTGEANFVWAEWGIDQGTADGTTVVAPMLNRRVPAGTLGTKVSGVWVLTLTVVIS